MANTPSPASSISHELQASRRYCFEEDGESVSLAFNLPVAERVGAIGVWLTSMPHLNYIDPVYYLEFTPDSKKEYLEHWIEQRSKDQPVTTSAEKTPPEELENILLDHALDRLPIGLPTLIGGIVSLREESTSQSFGGTFYNAYLMMELRSQAQSVLQLYADEPPRRAVMKSYLEDLRRERTNLTTWTAGLLKRRLSVFLLEGLDLGQNAVPDNKPKTLASIPASAKTTLPVPVAIAA